MALVPRVEYGGSPTNSKREEPPEEAEYCRLTSDLKATARSLDEVGVIDQFEDRLFSDESAQLQRNRIQARWEKKRQQIENLGIDPDAYQGDDWNPDAPDLGYRFMSVRFEAGETIPLELAEYIMPAFSDQLTFYDEDGVMLGQNIDRIDVEAEAD